jgi:hypothetical protein
MTELTGLPYHRGRLLRNPLEGKQEGLLPTGSLLQEGGLVWWPDSLKSAQAHIPRASTGIPLLRVGHSPSRRLSLLPLPEEIGCQKQREPLVINGVRMIPLREETTAAPRGLKIRGLL